MKSLNNNNFNTPLVEEDNATLSKLRKRNKIIIIFFISFFITIILIMGTLVTYLVQVEEKDSLSDQSFNNPSVQTGHSAACNTTLCSKIVNTMISIQSITKATTHNLTLISQHLENIVSLIPSTFGPHDYGNQTVTALIKCSSSVRGGLRQIRDCLRADPFVETEAIERVNDVEVNLRWCLDDLDKVESTAMSEVDQEYVGSSVDFLSSKNDDVWQMFWSEFRANWGASSGIVGCNCGSCFSWCGRCLNSVDVILEAF